MDEQMLQCMGGWMDEWVDGWMMDVCVDRQVGGWINKSMNGRWMES